MGGIFPIANIENNRVPVLSGFEDLKKEVHYRINKFPFFMHAGLLGSCVTGGFTRRSDLDGVVVFDPKFFLEAMMALQGLHVYASERHIPLKLKPVGADIADSDAHSMQAVYLDHIGRCIVMGGEIKGDLVGAFKRPKKCREEECVDYLRHKLDFFSIGLSELPKLSREKRYYMFSKCLEFPIHIARKMCEISGCDLSEDDTKSRVIKEYCASVDDSLKVPFQYFIDLDREYSEELERQLELPSTDPESYDEIISKITKVIPEIFLFARKNLALL